MSSASLATLATQLIASVAPDLIGDRETRARVLREIKAESHGGQQKEWVEVKAVLAGLARTARVKVQDDLSDALEGIVGRLEDCRRNDDHGWQADTPINMSNIPQHVQLILALSRRPNTATHHFAHTYINREPHSGPIANQMLYDEIMSDPFTGAHWGKGYDEEVKEGWTDSEGEEERSSSEADDEVLTPYSKAGRKQGTELGRLIEQEADSEQSERIARAKESLEGIKRDRYWLVGGEKLEIMKDGLYGWKDLTTLTSTASLANRLDGVMPVEGKVITSLRLQREILFALSGKSGMIFRFDDSGACTLVHDHPGIRAASPQALKGILSSCLYRIDQINALRRFADSPSTDLFETGQQSEITQSHLSKTVQAFTECIRAVLEQVGHWIADVESAFLLGQTRATSSTTVPGVSAATTPLLLSLELETRYASTLDILETLTVRLGY